MKNYTKLATSMTLAIGLGLFLSPTLMAQASVLEKSKPAPTYKNYGQCVSIECAGGNLKKPDFSKCKEKCEKYKKNKKKKNS